MTSYQMIKIKKRQFDEGVVKRKGSFASANKFVGQADEMLMVVLDLDVALLFRKHRVAGSIL